MTVVDTPIPDVVDLRRAFEQPSGFTVGVEEEVLLLHPRTLGLLPRAAEVVARAADPAVKPEMPASQVELATAPHRTVGDLASALWQTRRRVQRIAAPTGRLAAAAVHPGSAVEGVLTAGGPYDAVQREYGWAARRQLVAAVQVHIAVRPLPRALAVANALRDHLPDLAALAAAAPYHAGVDTGLASVRPKLCEHLPRQGIPPVFDRAEDLVAAWRWAFRAGALAEVGQWWWELRLHPSFGTVEVRVCDAQATVAEVASLAAVVQSLVAWLAARADAADLGPPTPCWKLQANRWSACRHGVRGTMADPATGRPVATADRLAALLTELAPMAADLGCAAELAAAWRMLADPAPERHRRIVGQRGVVGLCGWLADRFDAPVPPHRPVGCDKSDDAG